MAKQKTPLEPAAVLVLLKQLGDKWATTEQIDRGEQAQLTLEQVKPHPRLLAAIKARQKVGRHSKP